MEGGNIARAKVPCNGGNMKLSSTQANASGASSFRLQNASLELTVYALPPSSKFLRCAPATAAPCSLS